MVSDDAIELLAAGWLRAERRAGESRTADDTERARVASAAYDEAILGASDEELLLAWRAAERMRDAELMGTRGWIEARSVAEMLRMEYQAAPRSATLDPGIG